MPINLANPIDPATPEWEQALEKLQGNIIRSHGREHTVLLLLEIKNRDNLREKVGKFAGKWCTSAAAQIRQKPLFKENERAKRVDKQIFGSFFLSVWGYLALGYGPNELERSFPEAYDPAFGNWFLSGMEHHGGYLGDPIRMKWETAYRNKVDAMLLLACDDAETLRQELLNAMSEVAEFGNVLGMERGAAIRDENGHPLEHFGFRDAISNPRYFKDDEDYTPPDTVLRGDCLAGEPDAFGSYVVYRKLEQNVKKFREAEEALADALQLNGKARERAGAMIVGRFRDGSPVTTYDHASNLADNNFTYQANDKDGSKCPFHAHIRKVRPRSQAKPRMARRAVPYGPFHLKGPFPEEGSGLLFLSYQRNIFQQFGSLQHDWANAVNFPEGTRAGQDPVIGQGETGGHQQKWPKDWGVPAPAVKMSIGGFVTMKGGEFFFAPSMSFFRKLAGPIGLPKASKAPLPDCLASS